MSTRIADLQQKQLLNLLDTVPDKVLICSQVPEGRTTAECIYSNNKMNEFYGREMGVKEEASASAKKANTIMSKPIFRDNIDGPNVSFMDDERISLNEIIKMHQVEKNSTPSASDIT